MAKDGPRPKEARFMRLTKSMERQQCSSEEDTIRQAFLPTSYVQLRSLPARMAKSASPRRMQRSNKPWNFSSSAGADGDAYAEPSMRPLNLTSDEQSRTQIGVVSGTLSPKKYAIGPRNFSSFEYLPSEYDLEKKLRSEEKARHASRIIGATAVKTGMPTIPDKQGTFTHFRYDVDPYEAREDYWKTFDSMGASNAAKKKEFTPGGKFVAKNQLHQRKASQHELLRRLIATLSADWPNAFERCFPDKRGLIVCLFSEQSGQEESSVSWPSELLHYMHHLVKTHPVSNEFVLRKMSARWGKKSNGYIEFALQPPWVTVSPYEPYFRSHLEDAAKLQIKKRGALKSADVSTGPSRRMAFPPQTPNGSRIYSYLPGESHLNQ
mmetsp:Transcript_39899/g.81696  ORF Transcript_39899/g.81696 Transcript_39899/m.81696 type:complete len:379 (+) Transcript_39899:120-1256(+)